MTSFLEEEEVYVLEHPPLSPDIVPCDFVVFPRLKKNPADRKYTSHQKFGAAIVTLLRGLPQKDYEKAFKDWI